MEKGAGIYTQAKGVMDAFVDPKREPESVGGSPTSKDMEEFDEYFRKMNRVRNQKAAHSAGNYGADAALASEAEDHSEAKVGKNKISRIDNVMGRSDGACS